MTTYTYDQQPSSQLESKEIVEPTLSYDQQPALESETKEITEATLPYDQQPSSEFDRKKIVRFSVEYNQRPSSSQETITSVHVEESLALQSVATPLSYTYGELSIQDKVSLVKYSVAPVLMIIRLYDAPRSGISVKKPISGAVIRYSGGEFYTDENGVAELYVIPGEIIQIEKLGYKTITIETVKGEKVVYMHPSFTYTR